MSDIQVWIASHLNLKRSELITYALQSIHTQELSPSAVSEIFMHPTFIKILVKHHLLWIWDLLNLWTREL